jgi:hypothetical protein
MDGPVALDASPGRISFDLLLATNLHSSNRISDESQQEMAQWSQPGVKRWWLCEVKTKTI